MIICIIMILMLYFSQNISYFARYVIKTNHYHKMYGGKIDEDYFSR